MVSGVLQAVALVAFMTGVLSSLAATVHMLVLQLFTRDAHLAAMCPPTSVSAPRPTTSSSSCERPLHTPLHSKPSGELTNGYGGCFDNLIESSNVLNNDKVR